MKHVLAPLALLALTGCMFDSDPLDDYRATMVPTPNNVESLATLRAACPSLAENGDRFKVRNSYEGGSSLSSQREFQNPESVLYVVEVTDSDGESFDTGNQCHYEVSVGRQKGVLVNKAACIRLCDESADAASEYLVKRI